MRGRSRGQEGSALDQRGRNRNMKRRQEGRNRKEGLHLYFSKNLNLGCKDEVGRGV